MGASTPLFSGMLANAYLPSRVNSTRAAVLPHSGRNNWRFRTCHCRCDALPRAAPNQRLRRDRASLACVRMAPHEEAPGRSLRSSLPSARPASQWRLPPAPNVGWGHQRKASTIPGDAGRHDAQADGIGQRETSRIIAERGIRPRSRISPVAAGQRSTAAPHRRKRALTATRRHQGGRTGCSCSTSTAQRQARPVVRVNS